MLVFIFSLLLIPAVISGKLGLCCEGCNSTYYDPLANVTSWAYRYSLFIDDPSAAQWLISNNIEFVPQLIHKHVPLPGGSCNFDTTPFCTDEMLDEALAVARSQLNGGAMRFLMGWNEAYDKGNSKATKKYISPDDAAKYWRTHVQGMARRANLSLVSPTTGVERNKLEWLGDLLLACWAQRSYGCDVETFVAFSVHDYKCGEEYWRNNYGENGLFQQKLKRYLLENSTDKNWEEFVDQRKIWVTETNCNGDEFEGLVSSEEQCARITGQRSGANCGTFGKCGAGSIAALQTMETVARVSWWNTHQKNASGRKKTDNPMLVDDSGKLLPPGRALANELSPDMADCFELE